ncbi:MAG: putative spermidine/putrescine transport system substrate-binding protein [Actinomycetota bacterium]|jgi:putative spermidine/putrescine transport system substrate-binding protein|nr:putative spermidine/putrescine transport system substrate-binding protein [Actinomycetota bacterium]
MHGRRTAAPVAILSSALLLLSACGGSSGSGKTAAGSAPAVPKVASLSSLGAGEGQLDLINWAGYAEDGTNDKTVDWVHPFEKATGCKVNDKIGNTSDEMVTLMKSGQYDGVSASGDATLRLIYGGLVAPVNTSLVPNYATIQDFLKNRPWNSVGNQMYGIPHGWGANLLMWNTKKVSTPPTSWGAVFDAASPYKGAVTAYDSPIYIADAALYLMRTKPDLKITNPYALDRKQLDAAVALLKTQRTLVGEYWADYTKEVQAFESGNSVLGTTWQVIANLVTSDKKATVQAIIPSEGATGWSDTWMIAAKAKHPNCMYKWMDWITSAKVNAQVAEWFGEAPAQSLACDQTSDKSFCTTYHAADKAYSDRIFYWTTPTTHCLDGRGNVCTDYSTWTQEWTAIKG